MCPDASVSFIRTHSKALWHVLTHLYDMNRGIRGSEDVSGWKGTNGQKTLYLRSLNLFYSLGINVAQLYRCLKNFRNTRVEKIKMNV